MLAASNNVNNNVSYITGDDPGAITRTKKSNGMTSKEIQTSSTANIPNLSSSSTPGGTPGANRKFERGRDPHRQKTSPNRDKDFERQQSSPPLTVEGQQPPVTTRCSNPNCGQNTPSSSKHLLCVCGSLMVKQQANPNDNQLKASQCDEAKKSFELSS